MGLLQKNVGSAGSLCFGSDTDDGRVFRSAIEWLNSIAIHFAKLSKDYFDHTDGELVHTYGERQIHSIVYPAILKSSDVAFAELPVRRKPRGEPDGSGRVDYWAMEGNRTYLLELKHEWNHLQSTSKRQEIESAWKAVIQQTKDIRYKTARDASVASGKIFVIGLLVVPTYIALSRLEKLEESTSMGRRTIRDAHENLTNYTRPDWHACWLLHRDMIEREVNCLMHEKRREGETKYVHHAVHMIASIREIPNDA